VRRIGTQQARGDIVVWTDADMTYPNERIPELAAILDEDPTIDQVVGARTSEEGTLKIAACPPSGSCASWPNGSPTPTSPT
jgi:Glycosyl transferase family 2.